MKWIVGMVCCGVLAAGVLAEGPVAPREPLTHRDMGIYGWWQPYFWEGPFDFLIVQAMIVGRDTVDDPANLEQWNQNLRKARAAGKRVLACPMFFIWGEPRTTEEYYEALTTFLDFIDTDQLYAMTIGEENIFWNGHHAILADFYRRLKARYPDLPVYQFFSNTLTATAIPGFHWPWLPADGWMVDEYLAMPDKFEQAVRRYRMLGLPLVHIAWAAPGFEHASVKFMPSLLFGQLEVTRKYNVPTAFFTWEGPGSGPDGTSLWAWDEGAREVSQTWLKRILEERDKARELGEEALLDWDVGRPAITWLDAVNGSFAFRETFALRMIPEEPSPQPDFMARGRLHGLRGLRWEPDPPRLVIHSPDGEPVQVSLAQHWAAPGKVPCRFRARVRIHAAPDAQAEWIFEASLNGYDWVARTTERREGIMELNIPGTGGEVLTRLRVAGRPSGAAAGTVAVIDWMEVEGEEVRP